MRMVDIIEKKRDGHDLSEAEIHFVIENYTKEIIPEYQMSALPFSRTDTNSLHVHQKRDIQKRDTANARTPFRTGKRTKRFPEKFAIRLDLYRCRSQSERCYLPGRYDPNAL